MALKNHSASAPKTWSKKPRRIPANLIGSPAIQQSSAKENVSQVETVPPEIVLRKQIHLRKSRSAGRPSPVTKRIGTSSKKALTTPAALLCSDRSTSVNTSQHA